MSDVTDGRTGYRYSANISIMFTELPYLDRPLAARRAGFELVESWWPSTEPVLPTEAEQQFVDALDRAGVQLTGLNLYAGDMPAGDRGIACRPDRRDDLERNVDQVLRLADRTGCRAFNLLYGQLDDRWSIEDQHASALAAYAFAAERIATIDGVILMEPLARGLNGNYPLVSGDDVVELLSGPLSEHPNIRLLFDLFHLGSNGVELVSAVRRLGPWIGHVQVADAPGRGEPGSGALPIMETLEALGRAGYAGVVAAEYNPTGATVDSLSWLRPGPG